jgi:hypothetical protein
MDRWLEICCVAAWVATMNDTLLRYDAKKNVIANGVQLTAQRGAILGLPPMRPKARGRQQTRGPSPLWRERVG